jgi:iron complex outermembrane receptor protein
VTKKPDYVLSNSGNQANFSGDVKFTGKKYDISGYYITIRLLEILSASHTGNVNDLYNSITNQFPVVNDFTYNIRNPSKSTASAKKLQLLFDETASLAVQYSFSLIRLEFDVRRGDFSDVAALDLG